MDTSAIMAFAGEALYETGRVDAVELQSYIKNHDEVGKILSIEDIEKALDLLFVAKFLDYGFYDKERGTKVYRRYRYSPKKHKNFEIN